MRAKKRFGQHFLEAAWADKLVRAIDPKPDDRFVEIGPGPGALTLRLAPRVAQLVAIELDEAMIGLLKPRVPANVTLLHADFLEFDLATLPFERPFRVAGNLPYNVSSPILFALISAYRTSGALVDATLMLQREVATRLAAAPGTRDYGVLSIFVQMHADVRPLLALPPGAFRPPPKVHSSVISLRFRAPAVAVADEAAFQTMVRMMFMQRRKTLLNALRPYASTRARDAGAALAGAGIDPARRPETLQLTELARLAEFFDAQ
jgi:16S rRNA (adenine1518-N6/adenine1519-N6)-dimethyltransferase